MNSFLQPFLLGVNVLKPPCCSPNNRIIPRNRQCQCHQRRHQFGMLHLDNDPFYGLTDDGDFAILGVNAEETSPSEDSDVNMAGQNTGFDLSNLMSATSFTGLSGDNSLGGTPPAPDTGFDISALMSGLSGDSSLGGTPPARSTPTGGGSIGIGGEISLNDALFGRLPSNSMGEVTTSDATSATKSLQSSSKGKDKSAEESVSTTTSSPVDAQQSNYDENSLIEIEEWLLTVIPKLSDNDIEAYTKGLSTIGFHPECLTMCELKYEDLEFMKVLHRRYLFNEVTGIEHPFEV